MMNHIIWLFNVSNQSPCQTQADNNRQHDKVVHDCCLSTDSFYTCALGNRFIPLEVQTLNAPATEPKIVISTLKC